MGQHFKIYIRAMLLLCFFVVSYSQPAKAWSCFPPPLTNIDIIKAPVIFSGKMKKIIQKKINGTDREGSYMRYEVAKMYKGPDVKTIDIGASRSSPFPSHIPENLKNRLYIPEQLSNGDLIFSICNKGNRNQKRWVGMFKQAYNSPFPTMYLLITAHETHKALLIGLVFFMAFIFLRRYFLFKKTSVKSKFSSKHYLIFTGTLLSFYFLYLIPAFTLYFLNPDNERDSLLRSLSANPLEVFRTIIVVTSVSVSLFALYFKCYKTAVLFILIPSIYALGLTCLSYFAENSAMLGAY